MSNDIRAEYEMLAQATSHFAQEAARVKKLTQNLGRTAEPLKSGWLGQGSNAFQTDMASVLAEFMRLEKALQATSQSLQKISQIFGTGEQEAASYVSSLKGEGGSGGSTGTGGSSTGTGGSSTGTGGSSTGTGGSSTGTGGSSTGTGGSTSPAIPDWQKNNPLLSRDPNGLFKDDYLRGLIGSQFAGANTPELNAAMEELFKNPEHASPELLQRLATLRNQPLEKIQADYKKFLELRQQSIANNGGKPPDSLNTFFHPKFSGSTTQLRYGQVVGDAFGIDPVFGSALNPTGGLVMPGNWAVDCGESPVGYHGVVHDAAGYLYNFHNAGPGYNYLGRENRDTGDPLTGQREGIKYWRETMGGTYPVRGFASEWIMRGVVPAVDTVKSIGQWVSPVTKAFSFFSP